MLKKRFSFLSLGWLPLLMGVMLIGALDFGSAQAQTAAFTRAKDTVSVQLANTGASGKQDFLVANQTIDSLKTYVSGLTADSLYVVRFVFAPGAMKFTGDSVVVGTSTSGDSLWAYTNGKAVAMPSTNKIVAQGYSSSGSFNAADTLLIGFKAAGTTDTVYVLGAKVMPVSGNATTGTYTASNLGTTKDSLGVAIDQNWKYTSGGLGSPSFTGRLYKLLPGSFYAVAASPSASPTTITAGTQQVTVTSTLQDAYGNTVSDTTTYPTASAVLASDGTSPGNGTLTLAGKFHTAPGVAQEGFTYTKAEQINIKLAGPGSGSTAQNTAAITVVPGSGKNISVALASGYSDTMTVSGNVKYNVTVTDAYYNPVADAANQLKVAELTSHGGTTDSTAYWTNDGLATVVFTPGHFFVGTDTLVFSSPSSSPTATQNRVIVINAGTLGGVIADYAGTTTGTASGEQIAANAPVYLRAYLRDTYGNPINASDTSAVAFAMGTNTTQHGGALTQSGKALVSIPASQASVTFGKPLQNAVMAITIPYAASDTAGNTDNITATTKTGGYTATVSFMVRSNVPAKIKMYQSTGSDSSVVASNYSNKVAYSDSVWDVYGNIVTPPSSSYKVAPTRASYGIVFATNGLTKFNRGMRSTKDTVAVDTLYSTGGLIADTLSSGKAAGIDTLKTWAVASSSVASSSPVFVTPGTFAKLVVTPSTDTTTVAGKAETFTLDKQDAYGNHIDFGLAGNNARGNTGSVTTPTAAQKTTDSASVVTNWSILKSRTGAALAVASTPYVGKASTTGASIGGSLDFAFTYTTAPASADTAKFRVVLGSAPADTVLVRSLATTLFGKYKLALNDTTGVAGTPITLTVTPLDTNGNTIYTYDPSSVMVTLNHTSVKPDTSKDSTYYFTYTNLKTGKTVKTTGYIPDSIFANGSTTITLNKFWADADSMETITVADTAAKVTTTSSTFTFTAASSKTAYGKWMVTINTDTVKLGNPIVTFTVTPRDAYYNVNSTDTTIVNITTSTSSGSYNFGSNPKVIIGPTVITGVLTGASSTVSLQATVFTGDNVHILGTSALKSLLDGVNETPDALPKTFALDQNYPNPFNPTTTIKYDVPKMSGVRITIYDILGREVRTLVSNGNVAPGHYSAVWNGLNNEGQQVSSGVYFYRMQAGSFIQMKKMLLLK